MAPNANPPQIQFPGGDSLVKEILYEGHYYDVTKFIKKHPGGSIIEYYVEHGNQLVDSKPIKSKFELCTIN